MSYRVYEESIVVAPFDFVRPADAPSRGSECCSTVRFWRENWFLGVARLLAAVPNYRGSARVSA